MAMRSAARGGAQEVHRRGSTAMGFLRPRRPRTLAATLLRAVLMPILWLAVTVVSPAAVSAVAPSDHATAERRGDATAVPGADHLAAMLESGACWGDDGKPHSYPSRVWIKVPWSGSGDVRYKLRGQAAVDAALRSEDYSRVAVFCR